MPISILRRSAWRIPLGLILLSAVPAIDDAARLVELASDAVITPANARFFAMPLPVVVHILAVVPFSVLGALQFVPTLRRKGATWHLIVGRLLLPLGLAAALSGLWMTLFYPWAEGDGALVFLFRLVFGSGMLATLALGADAVRRRDFKSHGDWMLRAYAIGMGAGTQVITHLPVFLLIGTPSGLPRAVAMGAGWAINVAIAEWVIRRRGHVGAESRPARVTRRLEGAAR